VQTASADAALEVLRKGGPAGAPVDLVITDHAMPGMTGTELAKLIREQWPNLPIILATGYADLPSDLDATVPRLAKPYLQEQLAAMIAKLTGGSFVSNVIRFDAAQRA